jgi:uncharacterized protein
MGLRRLLIALVMMFVGGMVRAQQPGQPELRIEPANRTLTVNAEDEVSVEPEVAILHVGFETQTGDAQTVYADGKRISNAVIAALKQAGIPEDAIRSESQRLDRDYEKPHKFKLVQQWTVKAPPERAAEILDVAVTAGATSSGDIEWTVKDEKTLEAQALDRTAGRARENAAVLAKSMGVRLGSVIYVSNQVSVVRPIRAMAAFKNEAAASQPLAIEPHKVSRSATVYAVYSIE